ncbi:endoribonuclease L-PSP [Filimonas lacunae]|uniref:Endoribonuclease L-PSP n=1 Tax=Filimonas lacunae TaxID=477680 RepID=A0A173MD44_9BACT|nr:Rid family detoxifying hydrolase [Filimonas lacunae]BAV05399.1 endoribonuclease L-PSP [Filimonas lacunae]SIT21431.1 endoribonuclease L-PSP [Filimonas lacunae]
MIEKGKPVAAGAALPFRDAVFANNAWYISGLVGVHPVTGELVTDSFEAEVKQVMDNLGAVLAKYQLHYQRLTSVTIYLTSMDDYAVVNDIYAGYFTDAFPARVCIGVKELPRKAHIEIAAIAAN